MTHVLGLAAGIVLGLAAAGLWDRGFALLALLVPALVVGLFVYIEHR